MEGAELIKVKLTGFEELKQGLGQLPEKVAKKVARKAMKKAGEPLLQETQSTAPRITGALAESLRLKVSFSGKYGRFRARIQIGQKDFTGPTFYGSFVALGAPGRNIEPNDWQEVAARKTQNRMLEILGDEMGEGITTEAKKLCGK
jgi:HK97 gp10 family phage protein